MAEDEPNPAKRRKLEYGSDCLPNFSDGKSLVTFIIGKEKEEFKVHKEFVCYHSRVLKAAFESEFKEGLTQTYTIDDASLGAFRFLLQWFYAQKVDILQGKDGKAKRRLSDSDRSLKVKEDTNLAEAWVLGEKFMIPRLQNHVIERILEISENPRMVPSSAFHYIYYNTAEDSKLRRLIIDLCSRLSMRNLKTTMHRYPKELLVDYIMLRKNRQGMALDGRWRPRASDYFAVENA